MTRIKGKKLLEKFEGPMARTRIKNVKEILQQVLIMLFEFRFKLQVEKLWIVNYAMFQEE